VASRNRRRDGFVYPDLVAKTREKLIRTGTPWVIENVPGAPVRGDYILCGSMFNMRIVRHRLFEVSWGPISWERPKCNHHPDYVTVVGHGTPQWMRLSRIKKGLYPNISVNEKREIMEMPWANRYELAQAIPPAYTEYIGKELMVYLAGECKTESRPS
jgi:DNA (cytosine-5)-methyltransferase 1